MGRGSAVTRASDIRTVKHLTKVIESGEAQIEQAKWERAELLAGLAVAGDSVRQIAEDTGLKKSTVSAAVRIWNEFGVRARGQRPRYADANYEVEGRGPGFGQSTNTLPEKLSYTEKVDLVRKLVADPVVRAAVEPQMSEPLPTVRHAPPSLTEAWESWLSRLSSLLIDGAKLADRGDDDHGGCQPL